jgi:folate-binding Fe-S cluster repair protein YgfZ
VSNAEHLKMSEDVGMINISHFAEFDVVGPDAADLLEYICVAKVGGDTPVGKGIYTHFLDAKGGVRADLTVLRLGQDHYRVIDGADAGHRDLTWVRRMAQDRGANVKVTDTTTQYGCLGVWGPNARATIQKIADEPEAWSHENFPFAALRDLKIGRAGAGLPHLVCGRAGLGTALQVRRRPGPVGCAARAGRDPRGRGNLRQQPPHGKEPAPAERRPADRIQPVRMRPGPPQGEGRRLPRQGKRT